WAAAGQADVRVLRPARNLVAGSPVEEVARRVGARREDGAMTDVAQRDERERARWKPWTTRLFVSAFVLGLLAFASMVIGIVGLAVGGTAEEDLQRIDVPGEGTFEVEEAGSFTIFFESSQYRDEGVCERRTTGTDERPDLTCDEDLLRLDGPERPVVRPPGGGDSIPLVHPGATAAGFDLDAHLPVWSFEADEPGTYEISLAEAPLQTESIAVGPDGDGPPWWTVVAFLAFILFGAAAVAVFIAAVLVAVMRSRQKRRGGIGEPPPPPASWAPPTGPAGAGPVGGGAPPAAPPPSGQAF
ncbi:hypothetical protein B7486_62715, partial [cyanobacterium TDX16]